MGKQLEGVSVCLGLLKRERGADGRRGGFLRLSPANDVSFLSRLLPPPPLCAFLLRAFFPEWGGGLRAEEEEGGGGGALAAEDGERSWMESRRPVVGERSVWSVRRPSALYGPCCALTGTKGEGGGEQVHVTQRTHPLLA